MRPWSDEPLQGPPRRIDALGQYVCDFLLTQHVQHRRELRGAQAALPFGLRLGVGQAVALLSGVDGVIFHVGLPRTADGPAQRNVMVFADGQYDRSPCGSGTSARLALLAEEDRLAPVLSLRHEPIVGTVFLGRPVSRTHQGAVTTSRAPPPAPANIISSAARTTTCRRAFSTGSSGLQTADQKGRVAQRRLIAALPPLMAAPDRCG
ncbi:proline racemase family protein [Streptomyces sp. NPDC059991]|uniref:proline racemase family protein n=1 Tax=Streptomyces sp. NPDC059991 TaxID=3347028 RepID=UPI0036C923C8